MYTGMILENALHGGRPLMSAEELIQRQSAGENVTVVDARVPAQYEKAHADGAKSVPHADIRKAAESLDRNAVVVTYCNEGTTGNAAQNILINQGFRRVYNLSGGMKQYSATRKIKK